MGRRFQINPGPLRITGPRVKADPNAGRCQAITRDGLRCLRDAALGDDFCRQHGGK